MKKSKKYFEEAKKWLNAGNFVNAVEILNKLIDTDPNSLIYLSLRGEAYLRLEHYELALMDLAKLVHLVQ